MQPCSRAGDLAEPVHVRRTCGDHRDRHADQGQGSAHRGTGWGRDTGTAITWTALPMWAGGTGELTVSQRRGAQSADTKAPAPPRSWRLRLGAFTQTPCRRQCADAGRQEREASGFGYRGLAQGN